VTFFDSAGEVIFDGPLSLVADMSTSGVSPSFTALFSSYYPPGENYPATLEVKALSSLGVASEPITITVTNEIPIVGEGEYCDEFGGLASCDGSLYCIENTCTSSGDLSAECPEDYTVNELTLGVTVSGDNSGSELTGGGTCGGGGPSDYYSFTAEVAGDYSVTLTGLNSEVDTLLVVREYCAYAGEAFELACNDDIDVSNSNYNSSVTLSLVEGQTVYVIADSYDGISTGPYELTVTAN
jgi:hypothetical protein